MTTTTQTYTPHQVVWEITLNCNLHCLHCGSSAGQPRPNELTTTEALNLINDLTTINPQQLCLMGGEPFLRKDWYTLAQKITDHQLQLLIISNGYIITPTIITQLQQLNPYGISFSLDGGTPATHDYIRGKQGSFSKILNVLNQTQQANIPTTIITTINKLNIHELPLIRDLILNKNIAWQLQIATPEGRFPRHHALTKEEYYAAALFIATSQKKYSRKELPLVGAHCFGYFSQHFPNLGLSTTWEGCQAGKTILSIKSNGDITGCLATPPNYIEGNIRQKNIQEIWNNPQGFAYNRQFNTKNLGPFCTGCPHGEQCKGGCLGMSIGFTGKPYNHPYCFYRIEQELTTP